jgi:hypothetical protein
MYGHCFERSAHLLHLRSFKTAHNYVYTPLPQHAFAKRIFDYRLTRLKVIKYVVEKIAECLRF